MAIYKATHHAHYAQIPNATLRDKSLSFEARGVLAMLLSLPDNWSVNVAWICNQSGNAGRDKVTRILKELQAAGYMVKRLAKDKSGKITGTDWDVHPYPITEQLETRCTEKPSYGESDTTNKGLYKKGELQNNPVRKTRTKKPEAFKQFFEQYPEHRKGGTDSTAWKKWKSERLTESDADKALAWIMRANQVARWSDSKYVKGITKFIEERMWLTPVEKITNGISDQCGTKSNQPAADIYAERQAKLDQWEQQMLAGANEQCKNALGQDAGDLRQQMEPGQWGDAADRPAITLDDSDWQTE